jgi:hypothetical protein
MIVHPDERCSPTLGLALRALKPAVKPGRVVDGYRLSIFLLGADGRFGFRWRRIEGIAEALDLASPPEDRESPPAEKAAYITWQSNVGYDLTHRNYWNSDAEVLVAEYKRDVERHQEYEY